MKSSLVDVFRLISPAFRRKGIVIVVLLIVGSILDFFSIAFFLPIISLLIDSTTLSNSTKFGLLNNLIQSTSLTSVTIAFVIGVFMFILAKSFFQIWISKKKANYAYSIGGLLASKSLDRLLNMNYTTFTSSTVSQEMNMISNLPLIISNNLIIAAGTLFSESIVFVLLLSAVAFYNIKVFSFLVVVILPMILIYLFRRKLLGTIGRKLRESYTSMTGNTINAVQGLPDIRTYGRESFFRDKVLASYRELVWIFSKDHALQNSTSRLTEIIAAWCICMLILYTVIVGQDATGTLLLLTIYAGVCFRLIPSVNRILASVQQIRMHEQSSLEFTQKINAGTTTAIPPEITFNRHVIFDDICFSYASERSLLKNISIKISKGERIALTGRSGTGKTTLFLLLMRFFHQDSGDIRIDGVSIKDCDWRIWRNKVGYVPQAPFIMNGTISENIAFGERPDQVDPERVRALAEKMGLTAWIDTLPDGLETWIGERGMKISGGQRQRIAIARSLYYDAKLLLLDEVTNQLDPTTETEVLSALLDVAGRDTTIIMITHQPELLKRFESVYEMSHGTIRKLNTQRNVYRETV